MEAVNIPATHLAYSDESHYNTGRYGAISLITFERQYSNSLANSLSELLRESGIGEFAWKKLSGARERFAAEKMVEFAVSMASAGVLRIDVLLWDKQDSRHKLQGRDDIANLERMYYKLFKNVLCNRWPDGTVWQLFPDENHAIDWAEIAYFLEDTSSLLARKDVSMSRKMSVLVLKRKFRVLEISPCSSESEPLVQLADLFAGLAVYSRESFGKYDQWRRDHDLQMRLFPDDDEDQASFSKADKERCQVLARLNRRCKAGKLQVSLKTYHGLRTLDPAKPVNFWWYVPQHQNDRAPVRR
ncbi:MAG: DUF3800 domain-containing protein [Chloroflexi bacterium]|nr:DUF3800 domain-containing protein [Chloroflexota bacterium]